MEASKEAILLYKLVSLVHPVDVSKLGRDIFGASVEQGSTMGVERGSTMGVELDSTICVEY